MQQFTASISRGRNAPDHNTRDVYYKIGFPDHIDPTRTPDNVVILNEPIREFYNRTFEEARLVYNQVQVAKKHPERQIVDYYEHVCQSKTLKPRYEMVVQFGNKDCQPPEAECVEMLREFYDEWLSAYPCFKLVQSTIHVDEATPHMHLEFVPVAESKRGLTCQNSHSKALKQMGFPRLSDFLLDADERLKGIMLEHGYERVAGKKEKQMGGVPIAVYKEGMRLREENAELKEKTRELVDSIAPLQETVQSLTDDVTRLDNQRELLDVAVTSASGEVRALEEQRTELVEATKALPDVRGEVEQLRGERDELETVVGDLRECKTEVDSITYEERSLFGKVSIPQDEYHTLWKQAQSYRVNRKEILNLREKRKELDEYDQKVRQRFKEVEKRERALDGREYELKNVFSDLEEARSSRNAWKAKAEEKAQEVSSLTTALDNQKSLLAQAWEMIRRILNAVKCFKFGKKGLHAIEGMTPEQSALVDSMIEYGAQGARAAGRDDVAESVSRVDNAETLPTVNQKREVHQQQPQRTVRRHRHSYDR